MSQNRPILTGLMLVLLAATAGRATADETSPADTLVHKLTKPHHVYLVGQLRVMQPWIDMDDSADGRADAFLVVENRGDAPERLTGARTEAADRVVIASKDDEDGAPGASVTIPPRATVTLKADDAHLVLQGLHDDVRGKASVPGVLTFDRAGPLHIQFATTRSDALREDQTDPSTDDPTSLVK
jgi:copper(I)-binding protein